ncbi:MAG TPA: esterase [Planctomycetota bacterium]
MLYLLTLLLQAAPERATWTVDGVEREALVRVPVNRKEDGPRPLVFAWHGHGGTMAHAARSFRIHELWAEAVVVYPQGLPTPGRLSDPEGKKPGWQHGELEGRDYKFFDAMLADLKRKDVDETRIYSMGHSNGGQFTYQLWAARPGVFAALAPSGSVFKPARDVEPVPVLHVAGEKDPLVKFEWQKAGLAQVRAKNGCEETGKDWGSPGCLVYESSKKAPLVTFLHPGGHEYPKDAPALIVKFFREHARAK